MCPGSVGVIGYVAAVTTNNGVVFSSTERMASMDWWPPVPTQG